MYTARNGLKSHPAKTRKAGSNGIFKSSNDQVHRPAQGAVRVGHGTLGQRAKVIRLTGDFHPERSLRAERDEGKMIVLSLFDGMACGYEALKRAGIKVTKYYASEIDKYAM